MESTGVYWIPVFEILEARGFEVLLVSARDVKNVPGRKTDVNDAQWLQQLHEHGLLRGSFRPHERIVRLRALLRRRSVLPAPDRQPPGPSRVALVAAGPSAASASFRPAGTIAPRPGFLNTLLG